MAKAIINNGAVSWVGFDPTDNKSWIVEIKGTWTYVLYQSDEFTRKIVGYIVEEADHKFKAFNLMETYKKHFDSRDEAVAFVRQMYESKEGAEQCRR